VTDSLNNVSISDAYIAEPSALYLSTVPATPFCSGDCTQLEVLVNGGNLGGYDFLWSPAQSLTSTSISSPLACVSLATNLSVTATDAKGCAVTDSFSIYPFSLPLVTINLADDTVILENGPVTLSGGFPSGGTWIGTGISGNIFDPAIPGEGQTSIMYTYVDTNGCFSSALQDIYIITALSTESLQDINIRLYPNPNNGKLYIDLPNETFPATIEIINTQGQVINKFIVTQSNTHIDLESYSKGIYFVKLNNHAVYRIVKQ
jgi:hypothetical protein